jgi:hypothetical protein
LALVLAKENPMTTTALPPVSTNAQPALSARRRNAVRAGYLLMGGGLAIVKWPLLAQAHRMPLYEGVTLCLLVTMSLLAFLGLRHPTRMLPLLVFESAWKVLWFSVVALPRAVDGTLDDGFREVVVSSTVVVVIIAVVPWGHVWRTFIAGRGEAWR